MATDNFDIEKPELNLDVHDDSVQLPDEIPAVLDTMVHENTPKDSVEMDALIKDVDIYLEIADLEKAHEAYKRLHRVYANADEAQQTEYFAKVQQLFKDIRDYNTFGAKLKRAFAKKPKEPKKKKEKKKDDKKKEESQATDSAAKTEEAQAVPNPEEAAPVHDKQ